MTVYIDEETASVIFPPLCLKGNFFSANEVAFLLNWITIKGGKDQAHLFNHEYLVGNKINTTDLPRFGMAGV